MQQNPQVYGDNGIMECQGMIERKHERADQPFLLPNLCPERSTDRLHMLLGTWQLLNITVTGGAHDWDA